MTRLLFILTLAFAPALSHAAPPEKPAAQQATALPRKASAAELERYAEREQQAKGLEEFEGGRLTEATIIIVLLLVIVIIILI